MTGEEPKYKVFFPMKVYHVLFFHLYIIRSTNSRVLIIPIQIVSFLAAKMLVQRGTSLLTFLLTCLKGVFC